MIMRMATLGVEDVGINYYMMLPGTEQRDKECDEKWIENLGDDYYIIPLIQHKLVMEKWRKVNKKLHSWEMTLYGFFGYVSFYTILFICHPSRLWMFIKGFFSRSDSSRLQAALKTMLLHRKNIKRSSQSVTVSNFEQKELTFK